MTIDEAIYWDKRILKIPRIQEQLDEKYNQAIQLSIEALERIKELTELANERQIVEWRHEVRRRLPSETEE